jgi:hypothetical protein
MPIILVFYLSSISGTHKPVSPPKHNAMQIIETIQNRIHEIRDERVMLDYDLATLYEVETKVLNQTVKRNAERFPIDFMFRLTAQEWQNMRSQIVTASNQEISSVSPKSIIHNQIKRNQKVTPYAFTEQGVAMLSGVLRSGIAIQMNIAIMRAFVDIRKIVHQQTDLREQLREIKERLGEHDVQLSRIYDAMENLLDEKAATRR